MPRIDEYLIYVLGAGYKTPAIDRTTEVFAPTNIALIKYWGKRDVELNLPMVPSLSYTLDEYGTKTLLSPAKYDDVILNGETLDAKNPAAAKILKFIDLVRAPGECFRIETQNNIPTAAGVASSASGFAALTLALADIKGWNVSKERLSMLARLGSGSAARSFWPGLVIWHKGENQDGRDCYATPAPVQMPGLSMAVLVLQEQAKTVSSTAAMTRTFETAPDAQIWPTRQQAHMDAALQAIEKNDFKSLGSIVEDNARLMHDLIESARPPIVYSSDQTRKWQRVIEDWREKEGVPVYFTQDAGANLKLLFPKSVQADIKTRLDQAGARYLMMAA